jgi:hypothetical protein
MTTYNPRPLVARQLEFTTGTNIWAPLIIAYLKYYFYICIREK